MQFGATRTQQSSQPPSSSLFTRVLKLLFSVYLVSSIVYTSYQVILKPSFNFLTNSDDPKSYAVSTPVLEDDIPSSVSSGSSNYWLEKAKGLANFDSNWESLKALKEKLPSSFSGITLKNSFSEVASSGSTIDSLSSSSPLSPSNSHQASFYRSALPQLNWDSQTFPWNMSLLSPSSVNPNQHTLPVSEDFFNSKIFGESLGPSKIIPYYFKASEDFDKEDITITTLVTLDRFKVLSDLVENYQGPVSVTIHFPTNPETLQSSLENLHSLYTSSPVFQKYMDVHLVLDPFERQFNMWRNVAKFYSRTDFVMMLDVDFWICTDFRGKIRRVLKGEDVEELEDATEIRRKLKEGEMALVIPAFEFTKMEDGLDHNTFPTEKKELAQLWDDKKIDMFHASWQPGHGPSNYTRYFNSTPGEVYKVHGYTHSYEPYVIFRKDTPWCDERFIGYGGNKAACLYELYLSGVNYYVMTDDFLIHQSHKYAEKARKHERRYNRKVFIDFREELCFRYLDQLVESNLIDSPKSKNMLQECKKIKGFQSTATRYIEAMKKSS